MKIKLFSLLILSIAVLAFSQTATAACYSHKSHWQNLMESQKYEDAYKWAKDHTKETEIYPPTESCRAYMMGAALYKLGRLDEAISAMYPQVFRNGSYLKAGQMNDEFRVYAHDFAHWNISLAKREIAAGNADKAIAALQTARLYMDNSPVCPYGPIEYDAKEHADYMNELHGDALVMKGEFDLAVGFYFYFVDNKTPEIQLKIDNTKKRRDAARNSQQTAVNADGSPNIDARHTALAANAEVALNAENFDLAIEKYTQAIEIKPNVYDDYLLRGFAYNARGYAIGSASDIEKASYDVAAALKLSADSRTSFAYALYLGSNIHYNLGEYQIAYNDLKWIYEDKEMLSTVSSDSYFNFLQRLYGWNFENHGVEPSIAALLGNVVYRAHKAGVKIDLQHDALSAEYANKAAALRAEAATAFAAGDRTGTYNAYLKYDRLLFYVSNDVGSLFWRAVIASALKQYDAARRDLKRVLEVDPDNAKAKTGLTELASRQQVATDNSHRAHFEVGSYINDYFAFWKTMGDSGNLLRSQSEEYEKKVVIFNDPAGDRSYKKDRLLEPLRDSARTIANMLAESEDYLKKHQPFLNAVDESDAVDFIKQLKDKQKAINERLLLYS